MSIETQETGTAVEAIANLSRRPYIASSETLLAEAEEGAIPLAMVPDGYNVQDLEKHLPNPVRARAAISVTDADSFIAYLQRYSKPAQTSIYVKSEPKKGILQLVGIIDDHSLLQAAWRQHTVTFTPEKTVEWERWIAAHNNQKNQEDFATFLDDNITDIANVEGMPTGSQILALATQFEVTSEKRFKAATRVQSGGFSFEYIDQEDSASRQKMSVFDRFALGITPFIGGNAYRLDARLKYRMPEGKLRLWVELVRPDLVLAEATKDLLEKIGKSTGLPMYMGSSGL